MTEDGTIAFIMRERLTHKNLQENDHGCYIFMLDGAGYHGIRLYLKKVREDDVEELMATLTRRYLTPEEDERNGQKYLVYFEVEKVFPLVGNGKSNLTH